MPRPPPWWRDPLTQWARELRDHGAGDGLLKWLDNHPDEVAKVMSALVRSDGPDPRLWTEPVYRLHPRQREPSATKYEHRIDDLPVERQRLVNSAGRLFWIAFVTTRGANARGLSKREARVEVAEAVLVETLDIFHASRDRAVLALMRAFVNEPMSRTTVRRLAAQILSERPHQEQTLLERPSRGPF
jgi:hypothetical protein